MLCSLKACSAIHTESKPSVSASWALQQDVLVCEECLAEAHADHYAEEVVY